MDVPRPDGPDTNRGTSIFIGTWVLTAFVGLVLSFRFGVKAWISCVAPVSSPRRVWGLEDFFFALGFAFDVGHMAMIWVSFEHGLGRHFFYLDPIEKNLSLKYNFVSQPLAVSAAMWSRTGVIIFLYACFAEKRKTLQVVVLTCLVIQLIINLITIFQIFLQCGPNPYRLVDRASYFHYMWDRLPEDGSVVCQPPTVQALIGYIQGGFNTIIDFILAYLAGFEIWQFMFRGSHGYSGSSLRTKFKNLDTQVRNRRLWQTLILVGPLVLSGVASIVKTLLLSALGSRLDFTWNIVPFVLWVKIENSCIPIAATAPVIRLFIRTALHDVGDTARNGHSSGHTHSKTGTVVELTHRSDWNGIGASRTLVSMTTRDRDTENDGDEINDTLKDTSSHGSENDLVAHGGIMVKSEYEVRQENTEVSASRLIN